ncbi:MAG: hemerythrin domain-containing protein [Tahibacter sp.]
MTIIDTLKAEHKEVLALLKQLDESTDRAEKGRAMLFAEIDKALTGHAKGEEAIVYPPYAARGDKDDLKSHAEAQVEHKAVEEVALPTLRSADPGTREFAGAAKVLLEFVDHHAKEEEKTIFPAMKKLFTKEELEQLDVDYKAWKKSHGF